VPIYDFRCDACGERFEELTRRGATPPCPRCGATDVERLISGAVTMLRIGPQGRDRRRMEAGRRDRREREAERRRHGGTENRA
jgi:putative FmdB family regulatory protein